MGGGGGGGVLYGRQTWLCASSHDGHTWCPTIIIIKGGEKQVGHNMVVDHLFVKMMMSLDDDESKDITEAFLLHAAKPS